MTIEQTISEPQRAILKSTKSLNLFLAGVGSGKTHIGGLIAYRFVKMFPQARGFIGANTYLQLTQSTLFRIREYWKSIHVVEYDKTSTPHGLYVVNKRPPAHFNTQGHNFDDYYGIISFVNGCVIFTGSLDHAEAHYGKEFAWAILDETKDSDEVDIKEVILSRLRQKGIYIKDGQLSNEGQDFNPAYFLTSPAKTDWINDLFCLEKYMDEINAKIYSDKTFFAKEFDDKFVTISSTYHNLRNLPANYIDLIKERNSEERANALIYGNPFLTLGGEFYSSFSRINHVGEVKYNPQFAIHVSFDQNSVPYNSALIGQVKYIGDFRNNIMYEWRIIDEIALQNPHNSTEEVCEEFIRRYPEHNSGMFYYGDASGHNRSTLNKDFQHHYEIVEYKLSGYISNSSDRTLTVNPLVTKRRDFINRLFENKLPVRFIIDESCHYLIADMMYCKQGPDGGKDKHIVTDKETGDKYQKYGHMADALEYMAVELFEKYYNG
ncbi:MAG: terminase family protein [Rikenellaceae bacterium]